MKLTKEARGFGKNSILYFIALLAPKLVGVMLLPVYSEYIEPEKFGIFGYTTSIITVLSFISALGLNTYYLRFYPKTKDKKNLNGTMFWFMLLWNIVLLGIELLIFPLVWEVMNISFPYWPYMPIALLTQFFVSIEVIPMRTFRIKGEVIKYLLRVIAKCLMLLVLSGVFLIQLRMGVMGRYLADLVIAIVFSVFFIIYMCRNASFKIDRALLRGALKFSLPLVPADILSNSIPLGVTTLIERFLSTAQLGLYSMGYQISLVLNTITTSISYAIEPEYYMRAGTKGFLGFSRIMKNIQFVIISWICMCCGLLIREAEMLLLSEQYAGTWQVVQILSLTSMSAVLNSFLSTHAILQGRTKSMIWAHLGNLMMVLLAGAFLYPRWGYGALGWPNFLGSIVAFGVLYNSLDRVELGSVCFTRDFLVLGCSALIMLLSRFLHTLPFAADFAVKTTILIAYTFVLPMAYGFRLKDLLRRVLQVLSHKRRG